MLTGLFVSFVLHDLTANISIHYFLPIANTYHFFQFFSFCLRLLMLHIHPWPSCQSEILCTVRTSENKRKQSHGWTEMCECYGLIYADIHVRYGQCESPSSVSQGNRSSEHLSETAATTGFRLSNSRPRSRRSAKWGFEDNTAWYG